MILPGVVMTTSGLFLNICSCLWMELPPITRQDSSFVNLFSFSNSSWIWMANYRVGVTINALMYPTAAAWKYLCMIGSTKAAVLPEPVIELATTSFPDKITGIASDWIGVGFTYPTSLTAFSNGLMSLRSSKDFCLWASCLLLSLLFFCLGLLSIRIFSYAMC